MRNMAKRRYSSPILMELTPGDDPTIVIGGSQQTHGEDSMWSFSGIDEGTISLIELNCDDFDLQDMDDDGDYVITAAEFQAWYDANEPW